jgi:hypothetical protein
MACSTNWKGVHAGYMDWIDLTEYCGQWHALVNMVMDFLVPQTAGNISWE